MITLLAGCGDNDPGDGLPIAPSQSLFVVAHFDDDLIFMQPELATALTRESSTTVYVTSGDPGRGRARAQDVFGAAMIAYEHATGSRSWRCGYVHAAGVPVQHCRLLDRPVSMITLDIPDGGRWADTSETLLHLLDGRVSSLPLQGQLGGAVTVDSVVDELAAVIAATAPAELHTLEVAGTHGDDHPSHMLSAAFTLWGAARAGYTGPLISHRGYNVYDTPITLSETDYAFAKTMLGYFEACYTEQCGPCGTTCAVLDETHDHWLQRQYRTPAVPERAGPGVRLESVDAPGACVAAAGAGVGLADCASDAALRLGSDRRLRSGEMCAASAADNDDPLALVPCADDPAQYWFLDSEGFVANGRPPAAEGEMYFDHMRCLDAPAGGVAGAPVCGSRWSPRWQRLP